MQITNSSIRLMHKQHCNGEYYRWCFRAQEMVNPALVLNVTKNWKKQEKKIEIDTKERLAL